MAPRLRIFNIWDLHWIFCPGASHFDGWLVISGGELFEIDRLLREQHHRIRDFSRNQAKNSRKRGTTFWEKSRPTPTISMRYRRSAPFTVQVGLESLADARGVMLSLPVSYQRTPHWQQASDL